MTSWYSGPDRENIAQKANDWQGQNYQRWVNADFDALYDDLMVQTDPEAAANILAGLPSFESPNTSWEFNLEEANRILDEAGWVRDGDTRAKDGVELQVTYSTSVNAVRQKTQAVVKDAFNQIGIGVQLMQVDAGIFFDGSAGNDQNSAHMYWDIDMWTNSPDSPIPTTFMTSWYSGPDRENIAQKANDWQGQNYQRWVNADFDALYDDLMVQTDPEAAANILIQMNDLLIGEVVVIPEVNRGSVFAIANDINEENIASGPGFELTFWNIANWNRVAE
jgi:peptide/nickel transport system substrate-binding protein